MKLLVAYDGSKCAEAALDDLVRAGLPESGEAVVISVAEVWLPPPESMADTNGNGTGVKLDAEWENIIEKRYEKDKRAVFEAETLAKHARQRIQRILPRWQIGAAATYGSPAWEILARSDEFKPDLIVVGSNGRSAVSRFFLGSISQKVLTEARCSVRVARGRIEVDPSPLRVIIGFDGSKGARAAIAAFRERCWPAESEIRLVAATEEVTPSAIGRFIPPVTHMIEEINETEREWMEKLAENDVASLQSDKARCGLNIHAGNPKEVLVEEAERWNADCIFLGANAFGSKVERFLLGSTSAAVAARAHCSVEVVRKTVDALAG
ncbi:MAG: universal stress protein [Acidobacteria bacterium]|nr:universal stress protein [Acidobacteriota bacterium]